MKRIILLLILLVPEIVFGLDINASIVSAGIPITISKSFVYVNSVPQELVNNVATIIGNKNISIHRELDSLSITELISDRLMNVSINFASNILVSGQVMYIEANNTRFQVNVLPSGAASLIGAYNVTSIVLNYSLNKISYIIKDEQSVKLFGILPLTMLVTSKVNAETGVIEEIDKPWWSFLTI